MRQTSSWLKWYFSPEGHVCFFCIYGELETYSLVLDLPLVVESYLAFTEPENPSLSSTKVAAGMYSKPVQLILHLDSHYRIVHYFTFFFILVPSVPPPVASSSQVVTNYCWSLSSALRNFQSSKLLLVRMILILGSSGPMSMCWFFPDAVNGAWSDERGGSDCCWSLPVC